MLQVCPSISTRSVASPAAPSPLRRAPASLPAAASSGRSRSARLRTCRSAAGGRVTWMLTVADAVLLSVGHVTVTVTGTVPCLLRRRPDASTRSAGCASVPVGAVQRYVSAQPSRSCASPSPSSSGRLPPCTGRTARATVERHDPARAAAAAAAAGGGGGGGGAHTLARPGDTRSATACRSSRLRTSSPVLREPQVARLSSARSSSRRAPKKKPFACAGESRASPA